MTVKISGFTWVAVIPLSFESGTKIEEMRRQLSEQAAFDSFVRTPELSFLGSSKPTMDLRRTPHPLVIRNLGPLATVETFFFIVNVSKTPLELDQVSALVRRCTAWVRSVLSQYDANLWIPFVYPVFILQESQPAPTKEKLASDSEILRSAVLPSLPPEFRFAESSINSEFSADIGALESDFYRFSSYGALFYSADYSRPNNYIDEVMLPTVGRFRQAQAILDALNSVLDSRIEDFKSRDVDQVYGTVSDVRESVLRVLGDTDYSQVFRQRAEVSELLTKTFGVQAREGVIQRKLEILNSILDSIKQRQAEKATAASDRTNLILTIITVVLTAIGVLLAIPHL